jgi:hypothetical protein
MLHGRNYYKCFTICFIRTSSAVLTDKRMGGAQEQIERLPPSHPRGTSAHGATHASWLPELQAMKHIWRASATVNVNKRKEFLDLFHGS